MADQQTRPFSKDYSGLINQSVLAGGLIVICVAWHETMKRRRRGKRREEPLGSVESWQYGYLYQGRSWAKLPSPPTPRGWPLSWVKQAIVFPEVKLSQLRGVDASLYCRFIRGCFWFSLLHAVTTTAILLPIHLRFSDSNQFSSKSMTRALISALVSTDDGRRLLWIHLVLLLWVTVTWMLNLIWISRGAFRYRKSAIEAAAARSRREASGEDEKISHPHPQHPFHAMPPLEDEIEKEQTNKGLRLRTVMVTNVPSRLRTERELREYFDYYLSRPLAKPSLGLTSSTQPGFINKFVSFMINRARRHGFFSRTVDDEKRAMVDDDPHDGGPYVERVVIARKMTELSSLLDRREEMLKRLETAHIRLACKALEAVHEAMDLRDQRPSRTERAVSRLSKASVLQGRRSEGKSSEETDLEAASTAVEDEIVVEDRTELLIRTLGPYVDKFGMRDKLPLWKAASAWLSSWVDQVRLTSKARGKFSKEKRPASPEEEDPTIWEVLFSLPRSSLNAYQPLVHLNALFVGRTVPAIDYYTAKVNLLTALITELRTRPPQDFDPVSTAFVTFKHPDDARRACRYLAVHPKNPLACLTTMAPEYEDLDWVRVMKHTYKTEILKDWVVDIGVWAFTIAWIIPVSLLVALVSIQNIATVIPGLQTFLDNHQFLQELIQSLFPTLLTSGLVLLIPLILLLIAKKAHTINTLSALHDRILTRYHKFLVSNILVFFCVGVSALESFFTSFKTGTDLLSVVGESFPSAGPFYVGWFIFTTAIHGGFELALFGLPLIVYPITKRQVTPRKRSIGIRPRTFNYYYWLPNHMLIVILSLVFSVLNPLLMPFVVLYFSVETVVIKNQLLHVYAKNYEGNGALILTRIVRYSLDGLILMQVIFMAFMGVSKKEIHLALTAVMLVFTVFVKLIFTRIIKGKFEAADVIESHIVCGVEPQTTTTSSHHTSEQEVASQPSSPVRPGLIAAVTEQRFKTWKLPKGFKFTYSADAQRQTSAGDHKPIPFEDATRFKRLRSWDTMNQKQRLETISSRRSESMPDLVAGQTVFASPESSPMKLVTPTTRPPLVTKHEKHQPWDDSARLDRPYDNPYYTRPIENHLWLPRNPVGLLDLDDTVNVFRALTSDASLGQLGEWVEEGIALEDLPSQSSLSDISISDPESTPPPVRRMMSRTFSGDEEIQLPPAIAARVEHIERERNVDYAEEFGMRRSAGFRRPSLTPSFGGRRPSIVTRRSTNSDTKKDSPPGSRPRTCESRQGRPLIAGSRSSFNRASSPTSLSPPPNIHAFPRPRGSSVFTEGNGSQPPSILHQGPAGARLSRVSFATGNLPLPPKQRTVSGSSVPVSTREAVVGEVIAEEQQAQEIRHRVEVTEDGKSESPSTRSWLTSWMFSKVPWPT